MKRNITIHLKPWTLINVVASVVNQIGRLGVAFLERCSTIRIPMTQPIYPLMLRASLAYGSEHDSSLVLEFTNHTLPRSGRERFSLP